MSNLKRSVTNSPVLFINRSIIPSVKFPKWCSPILNSSPNWISLTNDIHQVEVHQVKFSHRWVDFISGWNSKWVEFKMGDHQFGSFTQGIIDLLINTTGEFVTERLMLHIFCRKCRIYALFLSQMSWLSAFWGRILAEILRNTQNFGRNSEEKVGHWSLCS